jgi:diguanylate cyclase (GGDEF)-like protein
MTVRFGVMPRRSLERRASVLATLRKDQTAPIQDEWAPVVEIDSRRISACSESTGNADALDGAVVQASDRTDRPPISALTIVAVDDDRVGLRLLTRQLEKQGHTVHAATRGAEALRLVAEVQPQVVITDQQMPEMDGREVVKALRATMGGRQIYVIMLTGSEDADVQVDAYEAGADDFVNKPCHPRLLAARLRACTRVLNLQDEVRREHAELRRCMDELGLANQKLQQTAVTDALTGLYNRRYVIDRLDQEWAQTTRTGRPLACLLIDIDHFKRVNDTHGHDVGDLVLQATAAAMCDNVRQSDVVCRLGGEEFVVIGGGMDAPSATACAERLRMEIAGRAIDIPGGELRVTLSIGVAVREPQMKEPAELLKAADQAVYAAKQGGRNQVRLALTK